MFGHCRTQLPHAMESDAEVVDKDGKLDDSDGSHSVVLSSDSPQRKPTATTKLHLKQTWQSSTSKSLVHVRQLPTCLHVQYVLLAA